MTNFRMHRAGVFGPGGNGLGFLRAQIFFGVRCEFLAALSRAEIKRVAVVLRAMLRRVRIDLHAADRIGRGVCMCCVVVMCMGHILPLIPLGGI